jgi:hypothetical protein
MEEGGGGIGANGRLCKNKKLRYIMLRGKTNTESSDDAKKCNNRGCGAVRLRCMEMMSVIIAMPRGKLRHRGRWSVNLFFNALVATCKRPSFVLISQIENVLRITGYFHACRHNIRKYSTRSTM